MSASVRSSSAGSGLNTPTLAFFVLGITITSIVLSCFHLHVVTAQSAAAVFPGRLDEESSCASNVFDLMGQWVDDTKREAEIFFSDKAIFVDQQPKEDVMAKISKIVADRSKEDTEKLQSWMDIASTRLAEFFADDAKDKEVVQKASDATDTASAGAGSTRSSFEDTPMMISGHDLFEGITKLMSSMTSSVTNNEESVENTVMGLVEGARSIADGSSEYEKRTFKQTFDLFTTAFNLVLESVDRHFGDIDIMSFNPLSYFYFLELEDERKNPSWKRRNHRFLKAVKPEEVVELHESFYLAELAYVGSIEDIRKGLEDSEWELVYGKIDASPTEPGHYLALKRNQAKDSEYLEVLLSVRGTKELGDLLSDAFLDAEEYRGGKAHVGVKLAGQYLVQKHTHLLMKMLELAEKKKEVKLNIVGHSLGAGAGSIAAIEFNDNPLIEANAIGFGCPALLSKDLAEQDFIVTVISDSDIVPRMSGASVRNTLLDLLSFDFSDSAYRDVKVLLDLAKQKFPKLFQEEFIEKALSYVRKTLDQSIKPAVKQIQEQFSERAEPELIPPGKCVHFYRDGSGFSARHTPCEQFDSIEVTRHLVDDHMTPQGYHRAMLYYMRDATNDIHYRFAHDTLF